MKKMGHLELPADGLTFAAVPAPAPDAPTADSALPLAHGAVLVNQLPGTTALGLARGDRAL